MESLKKYLTAEEYEEVIANSRDFDYRFCSDLNHMQQVDSRNINTLTNFFNLNILNQRLKTMYGSAFGIEWITPDLTTKYPTITLSFYFSNEPAEVLDRLLSDQLSDLATLTSDIKDFIASKNQFSIHNFENANKNAYSYWREEFFTIQASLTKSVVFKADLLFYPDSAKFNPPTINLQDDKEYYTFSVDFAIVKTPVEIVQFLNKGSY